jgi:hypothetical protein
VEVILTALMATIRLMGKAEMTPTILRAELILTILMAEMIPTILMAEMIPTIRKAQIHQKEVLLTFPIVILIQMNGKQRWLTLIASERKLTFAFYSVT